MAKPLPFRSPPDLAEAGEQLAEAARSVQPAPSKTPLILSIVLNAVLVAVIGAVFWMIRLELETAETSMNKALSHNADELEQLRTDVMLSTGENMIYLKVMLMKPGIDKLLARDIAHSIVLRAREHHRDPDLVLALFAVESNFNPNAISPLGAIGLGQIMPIWKDSLGIRCDLHEVDCNTNYALKILGAYQQTYGNLEMALTVYNRGPKSVNEDLRWGRTPFNGYAENIMRQYSRIKAWARP